MNNGERESCIGIIRRRILKGLKPHANSSLGGDPSTRSVPSGWTTDTPLKGSARSEGPMTPYSGRGNHQFGNLLKLTFRTKPCMREASHIMISLIFSLVHKFKFYNIGRVI